MRQANPPPGPGQPAAEERIDLRSGPSVEHWTQQLGVSREQLAAIVAIAGDRAADVAAYLKENGPPTTPE
jgi:hypothetical protein